MIENIRKHNPALTDRARELRKNMTPEERHLWYDYLRNYPVRFLRQKVIDCYIADFYCHDARLIVELDGNHHYDEKGRIKDEIRTDNLAVRNLKVIRIRNQEVREHFSDVCKRIDKEVQTALQEKSIYPRWYR